MEYTKKEQIARAYFIENQEARAPRAERAAIKWASVQLKMNQRKDTPLYEKETK